MTVGAPNLSLNLLWDVKVGALHTWITEGKLVFPKGMHQIVQILCYSDFYNEIYNKLILESIHLLLQLNNSVLLRNSEDIFG